jgi:hypothetical protein
MMEEYDDKQLDRPIHRENIDSREWYAILDDALAGVRSGLRGIYYLESRTPRQLGEMFAREVARQLLVSKC